MEKILRCIGHVFLSAADAIHAAKDDIDAFFFDILFDGGHLDDGTRIMPVPTGRNSVHVCHSASVHGNREPEGSPSLFLIKPCRTQGK